MNQTESPPRSILVYVGNDLLGDGLIKLPFLRALRSAFPKASITWLAGRGKTVFASTLSPLVAGLINEVIEEAGIDGYGWFPLQPRFLSGRSFDVVIDTQRRVGTTLVLRRIRHGVFISGAFGWLLSDRRPVSGLRKRPILAHQLLSLVEAASGRPAQLELTPLATDSATEAEARRLLPDRTDGRLYIGLAPGSSLSHKCWPLERFIAMAERLETEGHAPVFLLGPNEQPMTDTIRARLPHVALPLPADTTPMLTIAVGQRLAGAITNDSGLGHLLAAANVPLVVMFGPTPAAKFVPMTPRYEVLRSQDFDGSDKMAAIPAAAVWEAFQRLRAPAR